MERSLKIYYGLKYEPDLLAIEGYIYKNTTVKDFIESVVSATGLPQPNEIKSEIAHDDEYEFIHVFLLWNINNFKPNKLLEEIKHIYYKLNGLISDYDREKIDDIFNTKAE